jgi:hypothetical protein
MKVPAFVDKDDVVTLVHPLNGCLGSTALRIPEDVRQAIVAKHHERATA